jgi:hypothetical protein
MKDPTMNSITVLCTGAESSPIHAISSQKWARGIYAAKRTVAVGISYRGDPPLADKNSIIPDASSGSTKLHNCSWH